jgi:hypothetical protein
MGLPVSTLVRNVLLHTFDLVEGVVADSTELARAAWGRHAGTPSSRASDPDPSGVTVLGWQHITLNVNAVCDRCNAILQKGTQAGIGIPVRTRPDFLCPECLSTLASGSMETKDPEDPNP